MAPYLFTEAAYANKPIVQYGDGTSARDYTYIDDITEALKMILIYPMSWKIINLGDHSPVTLAQLITEVERLTGKKLKKRIQPLHTIESKITYADITKAKSLLGWKPQVTFSSGIQEFISWYIKKRLPLL